MAGSALFADEPAKKGDKIARGRELFNREWTPNDPRSHGGDGLGPVFNDSSCVSCHNAGGTGGAGPSSKNVDILSAFHNGANGIQVPMNSSLRPTGGFGEKAAEMLLGISPPKPAAKAEVNEKPKPHKPDTKPLIAAHAGFKTTRSVVLHRFGVEPGYENWRTGMLGLNMFAPPVPEGPNADTNGFARLQQAKVMAQMKGNNFGQQGTAGEFSLLKSQRNPTSLFGSGRMDSIPESVLIAEAKRQEKESPKTAGRVSKQKDGRIGRFGWKAQTPSLNDFVLTACAVELGLEVPGHGQGGLPLKPDAKAKGLDMNADECDELVAYVKSLPQPSRVNVTLDDVKAGQALFAKVGCTSCHSQKLGDVDGIYSDLLLHDLGDELGDTGQYGVFTPGSAGPEFEDDAIPVPDAGGTIGDATPPAQQLPGFEVAMAPSPVRMLGRALFGNRLAAQAIAIDRPMMLDQARIETTTVERIAESSSPFEHAAVAKVEQGLSAPAQPEPTPAPPQSPGVNAMRQAKKPTGPAGRTEWKTPPLWGLRDSGPYLHDGRADTVDQAVSFHGGQGQESANAYFSLSPKEKLQLDSFLRSLTAPANLQ